MLVETIQTSKKLSLIVFIFTMTIVTLTIIPVLFPAYYASIFVNSDQFGAGEISALEPGIFFIPVVISIVLTFSVFVISKFKSIKIPRFDISKRKSLIGLIIILVIFSVHASQEVFEKDHHEDFVQIQKRLQQWPPDHVSFEPHVKYILLETSMLIFGNYRIIPTIASALLLVIVYMFTNKITNNKIGGLVSSGIILQSDIFLSYSTTPTYTIFWSLFYLSSVYIILHKTWILSPALFVMSLLSKPVTVAFLPMSIFFILNTNISRRRKIILLSITAIMIFAGAAFISEGQIKSSFWMEGFVKGFTAFTYQMRFDLIIVVLLIPVSFGLYLISKKNGMANNISIFISGLLILNPILLSTTAFSSQPYRWVPLIIFVAIGAGMMFAKYTESKINNEDVIEKVDKTPKNSKKRFSKKSKLR